MQNNACPTDGKEKCAKPCLFQHILIPFVIVFTTIFGFEWAFHGHYMMDAYTATASLWRPVAEMEQYGWVSMLRIAVTSGIIVCLFYCLRKKSAGCGCPAQMGIKFGAKIGLLLGIHDFGCYAYMPIPMDIAVKWLIGDIIMGVLVGLMIGLHYKCKESKGTPAA